MIVMRSEGVGRGRAAFMMEGSGRSTVRDLQKD